jgi:hypothetical protein
LPGSPDKISEETGVMLIFNKFFNQGNKILNSTFFKKEMIASISCASLKTLVSASKNFLTQSRQGKFILFGLAHHSLLKFPGFSKGQILLRIALVLI